jgi:hypothetical protein
MDSIPPVITVQATSAPSYISKYYSIPESEVIPRLREVIQSINNVNMSGKTDIEKYNYIEKQFVDAFGRDFNIARDLFMPSSMYYMIGHTFHDTLGRHIDNPEQVNRQRLHGNASTDAIQDSIRNNFPADLTNRDLLHMVSRMRNEGVLDTASVRNGGTNRIMDTLAVLRKYMRFSIKSDDFDGLRSLSPEERDRRWLDLLKSPVHVHDLLGTYNVWAEYGRVNVGQDAAPFLAKTTGGELDSNGLFILTNYPETVDSAWWNSYMDMLMAEYEEYDHLIQSRMSEINAGINFGAEKNIAAEGNPVESETAGVGESAGTPEAPAAGEGAGEGESVGAEENLDSEDSGDSNSGESNQEAA